MTGVEGWHLVKYFSSPLQTKILCSLNQAQTVWLRYNQNKFYFSQFCKIRSKSIIWPIFKVCWRQLGRSPGGEVKQIWRLVMVSSPQRVPVLAWVLPSTVQPPPPATPRTSSLLLSEIVATEVDPTPASPDLIPALVSILTMSQSLQWSTMENRDWLLSCHRD